MKLLSAMILIFSFFLIISCSEETKIELKKIQNPICNEDKKSSDIKLPTDECGNLNTCDDSYDCDDNQRCENLLNDVNEYTRACCVDGLRGCKKAGEICEDEFDCESGLCIARNKNGVHYCSKKCDINNNTCPTPVSECKDLYIMFACVEPKIN